MELLFGALFIITGLLSFSPSIVKWHIRLSNTMEGTKTKITQGTLIWAKLGGVVAIIIGLVIIFSGFNKEPQIYGNTTQGRSKPAPAPLNATPNYP